MKRFRVLYGIPLIFLVGFWLSSCQKELLLKGGNDYELSQKEIEIKWAEAKSGRWFTFANYHALKQSQIEAVDTLWYMEALYSPVRKAQAYYKEMLVSQYQDILPKDVQRYLDSIYPTLYKEMDEKMSNKKYMDNLHVEYKQLVLEVNLNRPKGSKLSSNIIEEIEVTRCAIPQVAWDLENAIQGLLGLYYGQTTACAYLAEQKFKTYKNQYYYTRDQAACHAITREIELIFEEFKMCISAGTPIDDGYWDLFSGTGGDTSGSDSGGGDFSFSVPPARGDCDNLPSIIERMRKAPIKKLNKKIWEMSMEELYEYVYNIRLDMDNYSYELSDWRTDRSQTGVGISMGWSNNNVDIGYVHTHPFDSAPAPRDIFQGAFGFDQRPVQHQQKYIDYFMSVTITPKYIYVITVKDEDAWLNMGAGTAAQFEQKMAIQLQMFIDATDAYRNNNSGVTHGDAQINALLSLYGHIINVYRYEIDDDDPEIIELKPDNTVGTKGC